MRIFSRSLTARNASRKPRLTIGLACIALALSACGGGSETATATGANIVDAGSFRVELPDDLTAVSPEETESEESGPEETPTGTNEATEDATQAADDPAPTPEPTPDEEAIPLDTDQDPVTGFFGAFDDFQDCLETNGTAFLGVPDPEVPETMDPQYLADLQLCAAQSGILEAQQNLDAASAERTLEEIEIWNENLLLFADCLRGRGFVVAEPEPDAYGSLQIGGGPSGTGIEAPPGEELIDSPAVRECASEAISAAEAATAGNE